MLPLRSALATQRGRRQSNEDAVLEVVLPDGRHLLALADGIGGQRSGEVASAMAVEVLAAELAAGRGLAEAGRAANRAIFEAASREPACAGMGTTLVALLRSGSAYQVINVGDSRAYHIDQNGIRQITRDHSFVAEAVSAGRLSPDEIARSPWRNALTRSCGTEPEIEVDVFGPFEDSRLPHAVLLCSDGLHGVVPDALLREHLMSAPDADTAVERLVALALERRSTDNISVALMEFGPLVGSAGQGSEAGSARMPDAGVEHVSPGASAVCSPARTDRRELAAPARVGRGVSRAKRGRSRRWRAIARSADSVLFSLCVGGLLLWLVLRVIAA